MPDEIEITNPGPQSYLEAAVNAIGEVNTDPNPPSAEPQSAPPPAEFKPAGEPEPTEKTAEAKPAEPATEEPESDPLAELEAKIVARRQRREADKPPEVEQLRQQLAQMEQRLQQRQTDDEAARIAKLAREGRWAEVAEAAGHDPLNAYDGFTKQAADAGKTALERKIGELERWKSEREQREKADAERQQTEAQQRAQQEVQATAVREWLVFTEANSSTRPHLAALDESDRAREGVHYAQLLVQADEKVTYERVADLIEAKYKRLAARLGKQGTHSAASQAEAGGPKTITNDLAAQSSGPDDREKTREEYFADMMRALS